MAWWIWLLVALVIGIIELVTTTFVLLWISIAAFITTLIAPFVGNVWTQFVIFAVIGIALYVGTRPLAKKWRANRTYPDKWSDTMVGQSGVVVTAAVPGAFATVRVQGELWSARSETPLEAGQTVIVRGASATILTVEVTTES